MRCEDSSSTLASDVLDLRQLVNFAEPLFLPMESDAGIMGIVLNFLRRL